MGKIIALKSEKRQWNVPSLDERVEMVETTGVDTLLYCQDPWALRHQFVNEETGEVLRARCNRWNCLYCGPRKVDLWRQLVQIADPKLFLTLTKAGHTVEKAARALTTFMQALRRGSKGRGPYHKGARQAYPIEYFAVLERHKDFARNGFHWHILVIGVDYIPYKDVIQPLWASATHYDAETGDGAMIADIRPVRNARAVGYVTKYLTKALTLDEIGMREVRQSKTVLVEDEQGYRLEKQVVIDEVPSKAHRVRYSRRFFPERVADMRAKLFAGLEETTLEQPVESDEQGQGEENGKPLEVSEVVKQPSPWRLVERGLGTFDVEEYETSRYEELVSQLEGVNELTPQERKQALRKVSLQVLVEVRHKLSEEWYERKREALIAALEDLEQGNRWLSRRVIHVWSYQRHEQRYADWDVA